MKNISIKNSSSGFFSLTDEMCSIFSTEHLYENPFRKTTPIFDFSKIPLFISYEEPISSTPKISIDEIAQGSNKPLVLNQTAKRFIGRLKFFDETKGFGF